MGHWHLNSPDVETNKKIFVAIGGNSIKPGDFEIVSFPASTCSCINVPMQPPTGGTAGTVINHVGLMVPNVQEAFAKWKAAGVPIEMGKGRTDQAWVTTAEGLRIEILEDKNQKVPIKHDHVHFSVPEAVIPEIQLGTSRFRRGRQRARRPAVDLPGANLRFTKSDAATTTNRARCSITSVST